MKTTYYITYIIGYRKELKLFHHPKTYKAMNKNTKDEILDALFIKEFQSVPKRNKNELDNTYKNDLITLAKQLRKSYDKFGGRKIVHLTKKRLVIEYTA